MRARLIFTRSAKVANCRHRKRRIIGTRSHHRPSRASYLPRCLGSGRSALSTGMSRRKCYFHVPSPLDRRVLAASRPFAANLNRCIACAAPRPPHTAAALGAAANNTWMHCLSSPSRRGRRPRPRHPRPTVRCGVLSIRVSHSQCQFYTIASGSFRQRSLNSSVHDPS
jgi:hypothetical protein